MTDFIRHHTTTDKEHAHDLERVQDNIQAFAREIQKRDQLYSELYEGVTLTSGQENWLEHGLGRKVRGFRITDKVGGAVIWRVSTSSADLTLYLPLATTVTGDVDIEVY